MKTSFVIELNSFKTLLNLSISNVQKKYNLCASQNLLVPSLQHKQINKKKKSHESESVIHQEFRY